MRSNLSSKAQRIITSTRNTSTQAPRHAPFLCANCQRAAIQNQTVIQAISPHRTFASATTHRQQDTATSKTQTHRESILPQTHYDLFPQTFPQGPPPTSPFTPNLRELRKEYLQLQAKSHPDLAPQAQKRHSEALSMRLNEAYKTLCDPLRRARYLLSLRGIDMEDESAQLVDDELLMEVMELREAVDEAEREEDLVEIRRENNDRIAKSVEVLERLFAEGDLEGAAEEAIRLRYWTNVEESIVGWEKGKGGGLLHH